MKLSLISTIWPLSIVLLPVLSWQSSCLTKISLRWRLKKNQTFRRDDKRRPFSLARRRWHRGRYCAFEIDVVDVWLLICDLSRYRSIRLSSPLQLHNNQIRLRLLHSKSLFYNTFTLHQDLFITFTLLCSYSTILLLYIEHIHYSTPILQYF